MQNTEKKIYIKTYGCQMNVYDSEKMQSLMQAEGFGLNDVPDDSDLIVLNTCHIREKASEKMYSELGRIRKLKDKRKEDGKNTVIAVAGCVAQAEGVAIKQRAPYVDIVVGPQSLQRLPQLVKNAEAGAKKGVELDFSVDDKFDFLNEEIEKQHLKKQAKGKARSTAFLTIQEGCDKFCTFCVVPYTRGAEVSRSVMQIEREAKALVASGVKEITLLGQNVNAYHGLNKERKEVGLGYLANILSEIDGLERIRYSTSHPRDVDDELVKAHGTNPKLMPFIHLPVQSGSDNILKKMNRKHTSEHYRKIIDNFKNSREDIEFSSDFIVGYPGESEQDFRDTVKLVEDVGFSLAYSFIYSPRPGTPAANMDDDCPKEVKTARLQELQAILEKQMLGYATQKVGTIQSVLINRKGKYEGQYVGFTPTMQPVVINDGAHGENCFNQIVDVKINELKDRALHGELV
jgi:tRNA-2-methylthio-N6-dimethylallyladenosine synthase